MENLNFGGILLTFNISAQLGDSHLFQRVDSATGDGFQCIGTQIRDDLLSQQAAVDQTADDQQKTGRSKLEHIQPGQLKELT